MHAMELSTRNQLKGKIKSVTTSTLMAEVEVDIGGQTIVSTITKASVDRLKLKVGDAVTVLVKASSVMIGK